MLIVLRNGLEKQRLIKELRKKISEVEQANSELDGLQNEIVKAFI